MSTNQNCPRCSTDEMKVSHFVQSMCPKAPATPAPESHAPAPYFPGDKLTPPPSQPDPALDRARAAVKAEYEKKKTELRSALGSDIGTGLGDTFMRLGGDLARAEKQFRECTPAQYDRAREIMRQAGDRWRDHIDSMIASQRRMVEVGTGSETSPDAGPSIREAWLAGCKWGRDDNHCGEHSVSADPEEVEAALREFLAKPAEASEAEQIPHPVAEAEQSPQTAGDAERLVKALQEIVTVADRYKVGPYHFCGYGCTQEDEERVAEEFAEIARAALAQAPTRNEAQ